MILGGPIAPHAKMTSDCARVLCAHMLFECLPPAHKLLFSRIKITFLCAYLVPKFKAGGNM